MVPEAGNVDMCTRRIRTCNQNVQIFEKKKIQRNVRGEKMLFFYNSFIDDQPLYTF